MSSYLLSLIIDEIAQPLLLIFNKSIVQSIFPDQLKTAKIIPKHKGGCENTSNNFHPIALLPAISNVFEKLVYNRMLNCITKFNINSLNLYGFRAAYSTTLAVINLFNCVINSFGKKQSVIGIFWVFLKLLTVLTIKYYEINYIIMV